MPEAKEIHPAETTIIAIRETIIDLKDDKPLPFREDVFPNEECWRQANDFRRGKTSVLRDLARTLLNEYVSFRFDVHPGKVEATCFLENGEEGEQGHAHASSNVASDMGMAALEAMLKTKIVTLQDAILRERMEVSLSELLDGITIPDKGIAPVAYMGIDGKRYRVLVPVQEIQIKAEDMDDEIFDTWESANAFIRKRAMSCAKTATDGSFGYRVIWANGTSLDGDIALTKVTAFLHLAFLFEEHVLLAFREDQEALDTLDLRQLHITAAPDDWITVWDYRVQEAADGEPSLERKVYDALLDMEAKTPLLKS